MLIRPRRNRARAGLRRMLRETRLSVDDLVLPLFVQEGDARRTPIDSMPGHARLSIAGYKVPKSVVFVDELPRNPAGKVLKTKLRETHG